MIYPETGRPLSTIILQPDIRQRTSEVGSPIRKSADQSLFAAPHGLSQRTTSFIACACQGIHRTPLFHLIALLHKCPPNPKQGRGHASDPSRTKRNRPGKTQYHENCPFAAVTQQAQRLVSSLTAKNIRTTLLFTMSFKQAANPNGPAAILFFSTSKGGSRQSAVARSAVGYVRSPRHAELTTGRPHRTASALPPTGKGAARPRTDPGGRTTK